MILSDFLADFAQAHGPDSLEGAMVFLMLKRPLDEAIAQALALGPYHPGKPSPWSHCVLVAEPYHGPQTKILECTIRDAAGNIEWNASLEETLKIVFEATVGKGAGAVYEKPVSDYDDVRVTARGIKWLPGLGAGERRKIVDAGRVLMAAGVRYDLPGLLRELARLLFGIVIPPAPKRLFCSAFLQAAHRTALGNVGDFAPNVRDEDTTPDEVWYSHKGLAVVDVNEDAALHTPQVLRLFGAAGPGPTDGGKGIAPLVTSAPPPSTRQEIERVLAKLKADPTLSTKLQDFERVQGTLENALNQLNRIAADGSLGQSDALLHADDYDLSVVLSALTAPKEPSELGVMFGRDLPGFNQYEDFDPGWIASLWNRLTRSKVPFPVAKNLTDVVYQIPDVTSIAIAGDWGTGNASSASIAAQMAKLVPDYTIHLGDVYYSGTESEEQRRFASVWPAGTRGALALNSNHEMYSGGHGYFGVALAHQTFRLQHGYSYFALTNKTWLVIGLDSAHGSSGMYGNGVLNDAQILWLRALMRSDVARSGSGLKNVIVLSHHQGMDIDGSRKDLFQQVTSALGVGPHRWYWGHVHSVAAFNPVDVGGVQLRCRLTGHGGVPYGPDDLTDAISWTEDQLAGDPSIPARARNGFALLRFTEDGLEERFYDEFGNIRWQE